MFRTKIRTSQQERKMNDNHKKLLGIIKDPKNPYSLYYPNRFMEQKYNMEIGVKGFLNGIPVINIKRKKEEKKERKKFIVEDNIEFNDEKKSNNTSKFTNKSKSQNKNKKNKNRGIEKAKELINNNNKQNNTNNNFIFNNNDNNFNNNDNNFNNENNNNEEENIDDENFNEDIDKLFNTNQKNFFKFRKDIKEGKINFLFYKFRT